MEGKAAILFSGSAYNVAQSLPSILTNLVEENDADVFIVTTRRCKRRKTVSSDTIPDCDVDWDAYSKKNLGMQSDFTNLQDAEVQLLKDTFGDRLKVFEIAEENHSYWNSVIQGREKMLNTVNSYIETQKLQGKPVPFNGLLLDSSDKGIICYTSDQYRHVKRCYELFEEYERRTNTKYDYVMRARVDFICPFKFNIEHYLLNHDEQYLYVCGSVRRDTFEWSDEFAWFSRRNMAKKLFPHLDKMGLITNTSKNTVDHSNNDTIFSPECQFSLLLHELNINPIPVRIYRSQQYTKGNDGYDYFNYRFRRDSPISINYEYDLVTKYPTDINEHCPTLYRYAMECDSICEMGTRYGNSTVAFLKACKDKNLKFTAWEPQFNERINYIQTMAKENNLNFEMKVALPYNDERTESLMEPCDLLFIDTNHNAETLSVELEKHLPKVGKYVIMHDTVSFYHRGQGHDNGGGGMKLALEPFLADPGCKWVRHEVFTNNNGLTVLKRVKSE